ncbi:PDZ domain-containing protein [Paenibacillus sp. NPDC058174]|uniref:PDZ domain-containing protein n=1 Tax=Paenibacillus sp. NPDC058174 TaxID=3346366 RepID=UPI0036DACAC0
MNNRHFRYYYAGIIFMFAVIVFVELIWLPAPIHTSSGRLWIEMIDSLLYGLAIIPILWGAGAVRGVISLLKTHWGGKKLLLALRCLTGAVNAAATCFIAVNPAKLIMVIGLIAAALLLVFADLFWGEIAANGSRGWRRLLPVKGCMTLAITVLLLAALAYPTNYRVTYPAMTIAMNRYAHAEGGTPHGSVSGVLVFDRPAVPADWLYAKLLPEYTFERKSENEPPLAEAYTQVVEMKTDANSVASAIAMQKVGLGKGMTSEGVLVMALAKDSIVRDILQPGDIVIRLNGKPVATIEEMTAFMAEQVKPGDKVKVGLRRNGEELDVEAPTRRAEATDTLPERAVFGVSVSNDLHADIPRSVHYNSYIAHLGGPSHGAMLTLALIDQLTSGGVTNGWRVAGTGTIEADGSIGLVGGVPQKAYAVSRTDAEVFFVPAELEADARSGAPKLRIVPVQTIDDVLNWLKQHPRSNTP